MPYEKIAFVASESRQARDALLILKDRYDNVSPAEADVIVALGGDGFMLHTIHENMGRNIPIYGMNRGSLGFLMNEFLVDELSARLAKAERSELHPLRMLATDIHGNKFEGLAINEVSLLRATRQAAKIRIT
ncbi:MAG TPA: NAD kinase, partial [Alphaproteobacteria bacterium]|nr:NAD kinase [Alphaproteobacteria bacterium]